VPPVPPAFAAPPAQQPVAAAAPGYPQQAPGYPPQAPGYPQPAPGYVPGAVGYTPVIPYAPYGIGIAAPNPNQQAGRDAFIPRICAFIIDGLIVGVIAGFLFPFWGFMGFAGGIFGWFFPWILMAVYMIVMETSTGQTLGKMVCKVKVVREDRTPVKQNEEILRAMSILLYAFLIPILIDIMSVTEDGQSIGDKWAHTLVIKSE
jgi:uncharacterized RDD family membrane protein YckC